MSLIVGTGGHIDHGKTALVGALTGHDTDRLPEEKRRGISIDLGFTRLEIGDRSFGVIDVPGHEDFIRNMLAGATGMDLLLLVVAADEGVMPQTREHEAIARLLGVTRAVVALTKIDLVEPEWRELVREDTRAFLAEGPFRDAPIVPVSARTGEGLEEVRTALAGVSEGAARRQDDLFRLPVDRAFTVRGTGTVVTGTVWSGTLRDSSDVTILPGEIAARVRGLQVHGAAGPAVKAGERAAVALAGVDRDRVSRGAVLVTDPGWRETRMITTHLEILPDTGWALEQRQRVRVHLGTSEVMARARVLSASALHPGEAGWVQLRLEGPLVARAGDRFVIRSFSPVTTIGGGRVVDPDPPKQRRQSDLTVPLYRAILDGDRPTAVRERVASAGVMGVVTGRIPLDTGASAAEVNAILDADPSLRVLDARAFHTDALARVREALATALDAYHRDHPLEPGMELERLRRTVPDAHEALTAGALSELVGAGEIELAGTRAARTGFRPVLSPSQLQLRDSILDLLSSGGAAPPRLAELEQRLGSTPDLPAVLRLLEGEDRLVRIQEDLLLDKDVRDRVAREVQDRLGGRDGLEPADFREIIPVSRQYLIPLLEHLDGLGVTVRKGSGRSVPSS